MFSFCDLKNSLQAGVSPLDSFHVSIDEFKDKIGGRTFVLYGAGTTCPQVLTRLKAVNLAPSFLCDSDKTKHKKEINGIKIISPEDAFRINGPDTVCLIAIWAIASFYRDILAILQSIGYRHIYFLHTDIYPRLFPEESAIQKIQHNEEKIYQCYHQFEDYISRERFVEFIYAYLSSYMENKPIHGVAGYYPAKDGTILQNDFLQISTNDFIVHCRNGYKHDEDFYLKPIQAIKGAFLFEPSKAGGIKTKEYMYCCDKVMIFPNLLSNKNCKEAYFEEKYYFDTFIDFEDYKIRKANSIRLDKYIDQIEPSLLYLDISNGHKEALEGCKNIISQTKPIIALNGFRSINALLDIMFCFPNYKYYLRNFGGITMKENYVLYAKIVD